MQSSATTVSAYLASLPPDRKGALTKLRSVIKKNLPKGFVELMDYGMAGYAIPHSMYPAGYHCDPTHPVPFMGFASQKHFIAIYHMGLYADKKLLSWFLKEYKKISKTKLDMGKSCLRFKTAEKIPYQLIGELASKITPQQWLDYYVRHIKR